MVSNLEQVARLRRCATTRFEFTWHVWDAADLELEPGSSGHAKETWTGHSYVLAVQRTLQTRDAQ